MAVPLKYLSNFWRNDEMPWVNCGISLQLTWSANCLITDSIGAEIFAVTDTKLWIIQNYQKKIEIMAPVNHQLEQIIQK